ncbi:lyase, partial [Streptomyces anulatus]
GSSSKLVDMVSGSTVRYEGNIVWGGTAGMPNGYRTVDPKLVRDANGLLRLASGSPAVETSAGSYSYVTRDFDLQSRVGKPDVGADEYNSSAVRKPLTKADVGVSAP